MVLYLYVLMRWKSKLTHFIYACNLQTSQFPQHHNICWLSCVISWCFYLDIRYRWIPLEIMGGGGLKKNIYFVLIFFLKSTLVFVDLEEKHLGKLGCEKNCFPQNCQFNVFSKITFEGQFWLVWQLKLNGSLVINCNKLTIMDIYVVGWDSR